MAAPGQWWPDERYFERFAAVEAELARGFVGLTAGGVVERGLFRVESVADSSTARIRDKATDFLAAVGSHAQLPIDARDWHRWHGLFTRLLRRGALLEELSPEQRALADALLGATLSAKGANAVRDIRRTNQLAGKLSGRFRDLGGNLYWMSIMGEPSPTEPWGWQIDGHHVNLSTFVLGDQLVMTPCFLGAEPTTVRSGRYAGIELFGDEVRHALDLLRSLSLAQRSAVILDAALPSDVIAGAFQDNLVLPYAGIRADALTLAQRELLLTLIADYTAYLPDPHAAIRLREIERHLGDTHFAWIGGMDDDAPFYYRIHSPVVLIEFDHIFGVALTGDNPSRNHVHTVVRTPNGNDYGKDLLRQHLRHSHAARTVSTPAPSPRGD